MKTKRSLTIRLIGVLFFFIFLFSFSFTSEGVAYSQSTNLGSSVSQVPGQQPEAVEVINPYYTVERITQTDGTVLTKHRINGPSEPPQGYITETMTSVQSTEGSIMLPDFPSYNWVFGCSAVSGAMIAAYYDRNGYSNIYTGPTNGGVMPVSDTSWARWSDGSASYPSNPLIASRNGLDGRNTRGSIDDYWVKYLSAAADPYITKGWSQHEWGTAIGDFMKTSQSVYSNKDGETSFYSYGSAAKLHCKDMGGGTASQDGTYGRKLFYEARGYTVTDCYYQPTDNQRAGGFSLANFKAEIDAGHPVLLNLAGHSIVGYGYNNSTIYIRDTWDSNPKNLYTMNWGGSYSGMALISVSIVHLASPNQVQTQAFLPFISMQLASNHPPTDITISNNRIMENQPVNTVIGLFSTSDPDANNSFSYSLVSGPDDEDNSSFNILDDQLRSSIVFEYDIKDTYTIRVRTTDQDGLYFEKSFVIDVFPTNEDILIVNGNFEQENVGWSESSSNDFDIIIKDDELFVDAHSGEWFAWLGGWYNENSKISQTVKVWPHGRYLHYWYWINSEDTCGNAYFEIKIDETTVATKQLCAAQNSSDWIEDVVDLSAFLGSTVTISFEGMSGASVISSMLLDDISLSDSLTYSSPGLIRKNKNIGILKRFD